MTASIKYLPLEVALRSRLLVLVSCAFLSFALLGCGKKPDQSSSGTDQSNQPMQSANPSQSGGGAASSAPTGQHGASAAGKKAEAPKPIIVPAGMVLTVRLGEAVGSKISQPGQTFTATLAQPVAVEGQSVIPSGASASGTVVDAKSAGKFKGASNLEIRLDSITINGVPRPIQTSAVVRSEKGKGKRTATMVGGGAGAGALIGGLAGGGKGALIGGLVGAGAGTAGSAFTGNRDVTLPAESVVSFKLESALEIKR